MDPRKLKWTTVKDEDGKTFAETIVDRKTVTDRIIPVAAKGNLMEHLLKLNKLSEFEDEIIEACFSYSSIETITRLNLEVSVAGLKIAISQLNFPVVEWILKTSGQRLRDEDDEGMFLVVLVALAASTCSYKMFKLLFEYQKDDREKCDFIFTNIVTDMKLYHLYKTEHLRPYWADYEMSEYYGSIFNKVCIPKIRDLEGLLEIIEELAKNGYMNYDSYCRLLTLGSVEVIKRIDGSGWFKDLTLFDCGEDKLLEYAVKGGSTELVEYMLSKKHLIDEDVIKAAKGPMLKFLIKKMLDNKEVVSPKLYDD